MTSSINISVIEGAKIIPIIAPGSAVSVAIYNLESNREIFTAGELLPANKVVYITSGKAFIAGSDILASRNLVRGITIAAAALGSQAVIARIGRVTNSLWSWGSGGVLYLQPNGEVGITPPSTDGNYIQQIAIIQYSTTILMAIGETIGI